MVTYRAYDLSQRGFHSYYDASSERDKSKNNGGSRRSVSSSTSKQTVKPYLPSYHSPSTSRFSQSNRSLASQDDNYSFSSLRSRSNSMTKSMSSGMMDVFESRRSISVKAEMALNYDSYGLEKEHRPAEGSTDFEDSPMSSPQIRYSPSFENQDFLTSRRKIVDEYEIPHWSPDDEVNSGTKWLSPLVKPMVEFVDSVKEKNEKKRQKENDKIRRLAVKFREDEDTETKRAERQSQIDVLGKNGVLLFFPLNAGLENWEDNVVDGKDDDETDDDSVRMGESTHNVEIVKEPDEDMSEFPVILSQTMMNQLAEYGIPIAISLRKWKRLYSLARDGDSLSTMLYLVEPYRFTLVVIKTTKGEIFGAYSNDKWEDRGSHGKFFYGSGQTFLFSVHFETPHLDELKEDSEFADSKIEVKEPEARVDIYKWKGTNSYFQMCDVSSDRIALGGGSGSFGLCVEDSFRYGSTGYCDTFGNPSLCRGGNFEVLDLEVFGFVTSGYHDGL